MFIISLLQMFRKAFFGSVILSIPARIWLPQLHLAGTGVCLLIGVTSLPKLVSLVFGARSLRRENTKEWHAVLFDTTFCPAALLLTIGLGCASTILAALTFHVLSITTLCVWNLGLWKNGIAH